MGATNQTPILGLPQFVGSDKPSWLGDVNGAMALIDANAGKVNGDITSVDAKAAAAQTAATTAGNQITVIQQSLDTQAGQIQNLTQQQSQISSDITNINTEIQNIKNSASKGFSLPTQLKFNNAWTGNYTPILFIPVEESVLKCAALSQFMKIPLDCLVNGKISNSAQCFCRVTGNPLNLPVSSLPSTGQTISFYNMGISYFHLFSSNGGSVQFNPVDIFAICLIVNSQTYTYFICNFSNDLLVSYNGGTILFFNSSFIPNSLTTVNTTLNFNPF